MGKGKGIEKKGKAVNEGEDVRKTIIIRMIKIEVVRIRMIIIRITTK
jgi:hypothetical protein